MFNNMNRSFQQTTFEPQDAMNILTRNQSFTVRSFLSRFDAIFTLNQDLLLEQHYLDDNIMLSQPGKWRGWQIPGMNPIPNASPVYDPIQAKIALRAPNSTSMRVEGGLQPYFKLHGSSNWLDAQGGAGQRLLIMGGNKTVSIRQYPVLNWYHERLAEFLARPGARLMVVGYSFGDQHINESIMQAANKGNLRLFIVDPNGVDVLDKQNPRHPIRVRGPLQERLEAYIIGASRRPLIDIFGRDHVEHGKLMQFFAP